MRVKALLVAMIVALSTVAFAQDAPKPEKKFDPYATIRMFVGINHYNPEVGDSDTDYQQAMGKCSWFGANMQNGNLSGKVEIGLFDASTDNKAYLRHLYATYTTGDLQILVGQTSTPYTFISTSAALDGIGIGYGATFDGRLPQVKLTYMGLYAAFMQYDHSSGVATGDNVMPKTAIGYEYKSDMIDLGPGVVCYYDPNNAIGDDVFAWMGYVHGTLKVDAFFVKFNATIAQNPGNLGISTKTIAPLNFGPGTATTSDFDDNKANLVAGDVVNELVFEGFVDLGYKMGDNEVSAGVGLVNNFENETNVLGVYAQYSYALQKNFKLVPAVLYLNAKDMSQEFVGTLKFQADI